LAFYQIQQEFLPQNDYVRNNNYVIAAAEEEVTFQRIGYKKHSKAPNGQNCRKIGESPQKVDLFPDIKKLIL